MQGMTYCIKFTILYKDCLVMKKNRQSADYRSRYWFSKSLKKIIHILILWHSNCTFGLSQKLSLSAKVLAVSGKFVFTFLSYFYDTKVKMPSSKKCKKTAKKLLFRLANLICLYNRRPIPILIFENNRNLLK